MTNFEANNSSSLPKPAVKYSNWTWLSDRLPSEGLEQLDGWLTAELEQLESSLSHMVSERSKKRDQRYQFASSQR